MLQALLCLLIALASAPVCAKKISFEIYPVPTKILISEPAWTVIEGGSESSKSSESSSSSSSSKSESSSTSESSSANESGFNDENSAASEKSYSSQMSSKSESSSSQSSSTSERSSSSQNRFAGAGYYGNDRSAASESSSSSRQSSSRSESSSSKQSSSSRQQMEQMYQDRGRKVIGPPRHFRSHQKCPDRWVKFEPTQSCYLRVTKPMLHNEAEEECRLRGGHLTSIASKAEEEFLTQLMNKQRFHLGLRQERPGSISYYWLDGSPLVYTNWERGRGWIEPDHRVGGYPYCVTLWPVFGPMKFVDDGCGKVPPLPYVCKKSFCGAEPVRRSQRKCPGGWTEYDPTNSCYLKVTQPKLHFAAERYCREYGAHLTSITTGQEYGFVSDLMDKKRFHLGLRQDNVGPVDYKWLDGSPLTFTIWERANGWKEPNHNRGGAPFCVTLWPVFGPMKMVDDGCEAVPALPFLCKKPYFL